MPATIKRYQHYFGRKGTILVSLVFAAIPCIWSACTNVRYVRCQVLHTQLMNMFLDLAKSPHRSSGTEHGDWSQEQVGITFH